ncbi:Lysophospholipase L1 [Variovorax sp. YR750]|uniref:SGNH/GDSL hydrolase family protein n=1 Tax=Variovorax sp. YR750 TaxID=1884384 RepID=UPI0008C61C4C|nr:SGNH/GDSL hydrolase family protein [Variovorax sp. YR750]SEM04950.1 Lysophospholipase L1 [Variovorax sp. YR750]
MTKRIMCFGDSLTWGWKPTLAGVPVERYRKEERWTGVLAGKLGDGFEIIEEGLSGRTTNVDDPLDPRLNGAMYLPSALASHLPLDLVVLMLGTNDTKAYFNRTPFEIAAGISKLVGQIAFSMGGVGTAYPAPKVLLVAPPPLAAEMPSPWFDELFNGGRTKTLQMAQLYRKFADFAQIPFFDAGAVINTEGVDGIHFSVENNAVLGTALATAITSQVFSS